MLDKDDTPEKEKKEISENEKAQTQVKQTSKKGKKSSPKGKKASSEKEKEETPTKGKISRKRKFSDADLTKKEKTRKDGSSCPNRGGQKSRK